MNQLNTILSCMLLAYIFPITFVYYKYQHSDTATRSISGIITSTEPFLEYTTTASVATTDAAAAPPPSIPNPSLYRTVYANHGRFHCPL